MAPRPERMSPQRVRALLDEPAGGILVDTRPSDQFDEWSIAGAVNFPYDEDDSFDLDTFRSTVEVGPDEVIVTVSSGDHSSVALAEKLLDSGFSEVYVLQDGMAGWNRLYEVVAVPTRDPEIDILQVQRVAKGCIGYVVGWGPSTSAAVIDPSRHVDEFIDVARDAGHEITHVFDTHVHADHVSGGPRLAEETGASYCLGGNAADRDLEVPYDPLDRNQVIGIGDLEIKAVETPGHTPEHIGLLVNDEAIFTGDTLFTDSVGRTEYSLIDRTDRDGATSLYRSLFRTVLSLPDVISVLPSHFSTSAESQGPTGLAQSSIMTSIGAVRTTLPMLSLDHRTFIETVSETISEPPPNFERILAINLGRERMPSDREVRRLELGPNRCAVTQHT